MKLPIAIYGDPILRKKGARVEQINEEIRQLVADMIDTMYQSDGIGIAAPQVHRSLALFIICCMYKDDEGRWNSSDKNLVFINPKIVSISDEKTSYSEGCLSIPKVNGYVTRPYKVVVTATDIDGQEFTQEFRDLEAHIVLHENDHINGVLYIDRMEAKERKLIEPKLRALKKKTTT